MTSSPMNVLNDASIPEFELALQKAYDDPEVKGMIVTSAKPEFIAGADLKMILRNQDQDPKEMLEVSMQLNRLFRRMETNGKPIVAAINGTAVSYTHLDVYKRQGLDALALMKYPSLTHIDHVHHAGNSSQIVDGAAGVLIGSKAMGEKLGLKPRAKIKAFAVIGTEPTLMLTGPVPATQKALKRAGMSISDIDLFEVNEAFAAIPLFFMEQLGCLLYTSRCV